MGLRRGALWRIGVIQPRKADDAVIVTTHEWNFAPTKDLNPAPANIWQTVSDVRLGERERAYRKWHKRMLAYNKEHRGY